MNENNLKTLSSYYKSLKEMENKFTDMMIEEEKNFDKLPKSDQAGEPVKRLGFEIDALDNTIYLLSEVTGFIEENLDDRLS